MNKVCPGGGGNDWSSSLATQERAFRATVYCGWFIKPRNRHKT